MLQHGTYPPISHQTKQSISALHIRDTTTEQLNLHFQMVLDQQSLQLRDDIRCHLHTTQTSWEVGRLLPQKERTGDVCSLLGLGEQSVTPCHLLVVPE